jgi:hypothetical protein
LPLADREALRDYDMQRRSQPSVVLVYFGVLAASLAVIALGLTAVVRASAGMSEAGARDKTLLDLQVESSREIRRALATPVSNPPRLPPITARPARDIRESAASQAKNRTKPSQEAMNAMAMDQSEMHSSGEFSSPDYSVRDRHAAY